MQTMIRSKSSAPGCHVGVLASSKITHVTVKHVLAVVDTMKEHWSIK